MESNPTIERRAEPTDAILAGFLAELKALEELEVKKKQRLEQLKSQKEVKEQKLEPIKKEEGVEKEKLDSLIKELGDIFKKEGARANKNWKKALLGIGGAAIASALIDQGLKHGKQGKVPHKTETHPGKKVGKAALHKNEKTETVAVEAEKNQKTETIASPAQKAPPLQNPDSIQLGTGIIHIETPDEQAAREKIEIEKAQPVPLEKMTVSDTAVTPPAAEAVIPLIPKPKKEELVAEHIAPVALQNAKELSTVPEAVAPTDTIAIQPVTTEEVAENSSPEKIQAIDLKKFAAAHTKESDSSMAHAVSIPEIPPLHMSEKIEKIANTPKIDFKTMPKISSDTAPLHQMAVPPLPDFSPTENQGESGVPMVAAGKTGHILVSENAIPAESTGTGTSPIQKFDTTITAPERIEDFPHAKPAKNSEEAFVDPVEKFPHTDSTVTVGNYTGPRSINPETERKILLEKNKIPLELAEKMDMEFYNSLPNTGKLMYLSQMAKQKEHPGSWIMIDKEKAMLYVIDSSNKLTLSKEIILSKILGDSISSARYYAPIGGKDSYSFTAAGLFSAEPIVTPPLDEKAYGKKLIHIDMPIEKGGAHAGDDKRVFIHRAFPANKKLLEGKSNPADRRISHRCIRVEEDVLETLYSLFGSDHKKIQVGILPEIQTPGMVSYISPETNELVTTSIEKFDEEMARYITADATGQVLAKFTGGKVENIPGSGEVKTTIIYESKGKKGDAEKPGKNMFPIGG